MRKLITTLLAILMSLIPVLTGTVKDTQLANTSKPPTVTITVKQTTEREGTETITVAETGPEAIATDPPVAPVDTPCDAISIKPEAVPDTEETAAVSVQNAWCGFDEAVEATVTDAPETVTPSAIEMPEEISDSVTCINSGDNDLAPYTLTDGRRTPNPFENDTPNEVTEIDAEALVQPGDDRPGEGIHF